MVQQGRINADMKHMKKDQFLYIEQIILDKISKLISLDKAKEQLESNFQVTFPLCFKPKEIKWTQCLKGKYK